MITINNQLQQHEAAMGLLIYAQKNHFIQLKKSWYEKLQKWREAYEVYKKKQKTDPSITLTLGRMRCLKAMGEWEKLYDLSLQTWEQDEKSRVFIAPMGASAAWNLRKWKFLKDCVNLFEEDVETTYYRTIIAIQEGQFKEANEFISKNRKLLDIELGSLVRKSYICAYDSIVKVQQLSEMEEIVEYKLNENKRPLIRATWGIG